MNAVGLFLAILLPSVGVGVAGGLTLSRIFDGKWWWQ